jgi:tetratricopeptide (TPR) repeat protein
MDRKKPSSLDYEALLHELALKNWRRALLERDFARALSNADQLVRSRDPFWQWQGSLDLAATHVCQGRSESAREALEKAKEHFRDVPGLRAPVFEMEANLWLETGRPRRALEATRNASIETPLLSYFGALAHARLGEVDAALSGARRLQRSETEREVALYHHVAAELHPESAVAHLVKGTERLPAREPSAAGILVRYALGSSLLARDEHAAALAVFEDLLRVEEAIFLWPIPFIRSLFHRGKILSLQGDLTGAAADGERFLSFWSAGDLDRERVDEARHWVKS